MIIGIDTRLSTKKDQLGHVGVVTSTDTTGLRYRAFVKVTDRIGRYSTDLTQILKESIEKFQGEKPSRILIYRAGMNMNDLSRGEAITECYGIKKTLDSMCNEGMIKEIPRIAFIGYNRSSNVRFMRTDEPKCGETIDDEDLDQLTQAEREEYDKLKYNVPIGTVIDTQIVDKNSFYLVSHCAVVVSLILTVFRVVISRFKGTTKPAKYTIVRDEWMMTANDILGITYTLCNMSPRTRKSVKRPLPITLTACLLDRMNEMYPETHRREEWKMDLKIHENLVEEQFYV